jgi:predicted nucleic acid-binding protein
VKRVFVDSSGFFAFDCQDDRWHERARTFFAEADAGRWSMVTSNAVIYEVHALLLTRMREGRRRALQFLDRLALTDVRIERVRPSDEKRAIELLRSRHDKDYSLCDALSFVMMERLHIREAIAFDRHFRQYGQFVVL